jgi:hypothetical protein
VALLFAGLGCPELAADTGMISPRFRVDIDCEYPPTASLIYIKKLSASPWIHTCTKMYHYNL